MYTLNTEAARSADNVGGRITEKGKYIGKFTRAQHIVADSGTIGIDFDFVSDDGRKARFSIYTTRADGSTIYGYKQLMAIMTCLELRQLAEPKSIPAKVYDYDAGTEVEKVVPQFPELLGKPIGLLLHMEEYGDNGKWRPAMSGAFQASTELVASEILDRKTQPMKLPAMVQALRDRPKKSAAPQPAISNIGSPADIDSDIPF